MNSIQIEIKWDKPAWNQLQKIFDYVKVDSLQNAIKLRSDIIKKIDTIPNQSTRFGIDKYKTNNDGSFRYFELHHLRVSFRLTTDYIKILRIRSTHQKPLHF